MKIQGLRWSNDGVAGMIRENDNSKIVDQKRGAGATGVIPGAKRKRAEPWVWLYTGRFSGSKKRNAAWVNYHSRLFI